MRIPCLGKRAPHHADHAHRRMRLAGYLPAELPDPPERVEWGGPVTRWGLYDNDRIENCGIVAAANLIRLWTAHAGTQVDLSDRAVLDAYTVVSGYDPDTGADDKGAVVSDVLAMWSTRAMGGIGGHVLAGFAEIERTDATAIRQAVALFGGCLIGLQLPKAVQGIGGSWIDVPRGPDDLTPAGMYARVEGLTEDWAPGSWGGHCVVCIAADLDGFTVITWGNTLRMSNRFAATYIDEAWAALSTDWIGAGGAPNGLDLAALQADLAALEGAHTPGTDPPT
jgi:hypothetical protein